MTKPALTDREYRGKQLEVHLRSGFFDASRDGRPMWAVFTVRPGPYPNTLELYATESVAGGVRRKRQDQGFDAEVFVYSAEEVQAAGRSI